MNWLSFVSRLLPHASKLDDIVEAIDDINHAEGIDGYWSAIKRLGDLIAPILTSVVAAEFADETVAAQAFGDGKLIGRLKDFYESPIGQMLLQLLMRKLTG